MDFAHAYQETQRSVASTLRRLRAHGVRFHRFGESRPGVNPARLTDRGVDDVARREAEAIVQRAIIEHNEARR